MDRISRITSKPVKILILLVLISVGLIVLFYGGLFLIFITSDQASYHGNELNIGPIDYDSVVIKAEKAGYDVSGPNIRLENSNLIEPGHIESLEKRFNGNYKVSGIVFYYNVDTYLDISRDNNNRTIVSLINLSHVDIPGNFTSLQPSEFPDDSWMIKLLGLSLGLDENSSREVLKRLKIEAAKQQLTVSMSTNESVDFPTIYTYLNESSTNTVIKTGIGNEEQFYKDGNEIGYVGFVIPEAIISTSRNFNRYNLDVCSSGFIRADIIMHIGSAGNKIPEKEYKSVFKEMFGIVGLPVEKVDEINFDYTASIW